MRARNMRSLERSKNKAKGEDLQRQLLNMPILSEDEPDRSKIIFSSKDEDGGGDVDEENPD